MESRNNSYRGYGTHQMPINFYSEDFIAGFTGLGPRNRMSVVRRFFCLFVTFDFLFVGLLWVICVVINGENVYKALEEQVLHYNIETSLFDVVLAAAIRFLLLILFYGIFKINHWIIVASTTALSCGFLIVKVFYFIWPPNQQPVFQVMLIIISFVISWFETWFLDSRVNPQEEYSRTLTDGKMI
jgi:StAR-related lipid transfer protein 3